MKQEQLEKLLQIAETEGSAAALKIAQDTGDVEVEMTNVSIGMQTRIKNRRNRQAHGRSVIKGFK